VAPTNYNDERNLFLTRIIPSRISFCFAENRDVKRSRHKTAVEADNIAGRRRRAATARFQGRDIKAMVAKTMIDARAVMCVALLVLGTGWRTTLAAPLDDAAEKYRPYLIEGIGQALAGARNLRERVAANDLPGAKKAWISARAGWERSEVFTAGFVPELDTEIDAWPNADSGFHAIEARLFGAGRTDAGNDTDALVEHLDNLHGRLSNMALTPQGLLDGIVRLAYEVGESKADGGESRISGTSLDDMRNNVAGIDFAYQTIFSATLKTADAKLADGVSTRIERLKRIVAAKDLPSIDVSELRRSSEELVILLQNASLKLGLPRATLEAKSQ
jgi:iron uptake system EfeUOB component EfeO/EfeM